MRYCIAPLFSSTGATSTRIALGKHFLLLIVSPVILEPREFPALEGDCLHCGATGRQQNSDTEARGEEGTVWKGSDKRGAYVKNQRGTTGH